MNIDDYLSFIHRIELLLVKDSTPYIYDWLVGEKGGISACSYCYRYLQNEPLGLSINSTSIIFMYLQLI